MVGGYEISLVLPAGTSPALLREYFKLVREKERAVDEEWGGRPLSERNDYFELNEPTTKTQWITKWLEPNLVKLLDEEQIDILFEPREGIDPVIYEREKIATLLKIFQEEKADFVTQSRKQYPELWFEGTYIALLEFASNHETVGVSIPM